jgi:hypothetical protein
MVSVAWKLSRIEQHHHDQVIYSGEEITGTKTITQKTVLNSSPNADGIFSGFCYIFYNVKCAHLSIRGQDNRLTITLPISQCSLEQVV